jgi:acyl-CoA synthetase (AMP-forming)/AMP-acid ligase II
VPVALLCTRDRRTLVGLLAVWRLGGVPALLDAGQPDARVADLLDVVRPAAVVSPAGDPWSAVAGSAVRPGPHPAVAVPTAPPNSYVLFTSGSTGRPKTVLSGGRPLAAFLDWYRDTFALGPEDRFAVLSGLGHDPLLRDALAPVWVRGVSLWPPERLMREPGHLADWIAGHGVTVANVTPPLGEMLCLGPAGALPSARLLCSGGDTLRADLVNRLRRLAPGAEVVNCYGATETPQVVAYHVVPDVAGAGPVPLGTGANGATVEVRGAGGRPAGTGELGEIFVRSPHLAAGYLEAGPDGPVLRRLAPVDEPDVYATGDLGRFRPDGTVDFHGRRDRQFSIRGFRVEAAEVEAALGATAGVAECAVTVTGAGAADPVTAREELWGCVVPAAGRALDPDEVRASLRAHLPDHLVPRILVTTDPLPRRYNGKIDQERLGAFIADRAPRPTQVAQPRDELELILVDLWSTVLGAAPAHLAESFFDRGDSLLLTQFVVRVNRVLGTDLSVAEAFVDPTVERLAARLRGGPAEANAAAIVRSAIRETDEQPAAVH